MHRFGDNLVLDFLAGFGLDDPHFARAGDEELLAVRRHLHEIDILQDRFLLALLTVGIEDLKGTLVPTPQVDDVVLIVDGHIPESAAFNRQAESPRFHILQVDFDRLGFILVFLLILFILRLLFTRSY